LALGGPNKYTKQKHPLVEGVFAIVLLFLLYFISILFYLSKI